MVVLNKIYTRTGDKGDTALVDGSRVPKHSARVESYGSVDELNAQLGVARLSTADACAEALAADLDAALGRIQNDLFDLGADLGRPDMEKDSEAGYPVLRMVAEQVDRLEREIDAMNKDLQPLRSFILPGGSPLATQLHVCRTVCRRAERRATELAGVESVNEHAVKYLNRLSDWLFVAGRVANGNGADDVLWVPGANR